MFVEFKATSSASNLGFGLRAFAYVMDYVLTSNAESLTTAINQGLDYYIVYSDQNPGLWTRRETSGDFSGIAPQYWAYSQRVIGKPDQAFYHKGFALRWNSSATTISNNYFQGYMGAFQDPADRTNFASFDFARPLNWAFTTSPQSANNFSVLNSNNRAVSADRYIISAAEGYMFIGNLDQATFWAITDGTTLPIHEYTSSFAIPMLGITGAGDNATALTRHDLRVHVHKYDSGIGATYNQLSSFSQQINGDSAAPPNTVNFLNLYPSSLSNQGFLNRFDAAGKRTTALYPIIIGNPIRGNAYQTTEGLLILSGQNHVTGETFYVGSSRYYKFVCTHDRTNRLPAFAGLTIGVPIR